MPFEQAPMGTTGLETAFAALYTGLVLPGVLELGLLVERMSAGARAVRAARAARSRAGEPANLALVDLDAEWAAGEHGWESRSENCCFAGRRLHGRVLLTLAAGARRPPRPRAGAGGAPDGPARRATARTLVVVDVQEGFRSYDVLRAASPRPARSSLAGRADPRLPALVSEQYPKGLGHTAPEVGLGDEPRIEKTVFSAVRAEGFDLGGARAGARLRDRGARVRQPDRPRPARPGASRCTSPPTRSARATSSTTSAGLERMERAGAVVTTVEAALFELLERAGTPEFKAVQKLII